MELKPIPPSPPHHHATSANASTGDRLRMVLAGNIRLHAQARGFRLNELANRAGVSRSQFYNVLRRRSSPSLDWISKIADVLTIPAAELLRPTPQPTAAPPLPVPEPAANSTMSTDA